MNSAHPPRRVFLSHTAELRRYPERRTFIAAAESAVIRAGEAVTDMAYFAVRDELPAQACRRAVENADVYVLIAGFCYGSLVPDHLGLSHTELEFDTATAAGMQRLVFLVDEGADGPARMFLDPENAGRQVAFRARLRAEGLLSGTVANPDNLETQLFQALAELAHRSSPARSTTRRSFTERVMQTESSDRISALATADLTGRKVIIASTWDGVVHVWDLATGEPATEPIAHTTPVHRLATAQLDTGPLIIFSGADHAVSMWDLDARSIVGRLRSHRSSVHSVTTTELNGRLVIVSGGRHDGTARITDLATGEPIDTPLSDHAADVDSLVVAQLDDRPVVVAASFAVGTRVFDLASGDAVSKLPFTAHTRSPCALTTAELDGRPVILTGSLSDHDLCAWDLATGAPIGEPSDSERGWHVDMITTGRIGRHTIVVLPGFDRIVVWDLATRKPAAWPLMDHPAPVSAVAMTHAGGRTVLISGHGDGSVRTWDLTARTNLSRSPRSVSQRR